MRTIATTDGACDVYDGYDDYLMLTSQRPSIISDLCECTAVSQRRLEELLTLDNERYEMWRLQYAQYAALPWYKRMMVKRPLCTTVSFHDVKCLIDAVNVLADTIDQMDKYLDRYKDNKDMFFFIDYGRILKREALYETKYQLK